MPTEDYVRYQSDSWNVVVTLLTSAAGYHEVRGPNQPLAKAEEALDTIRQGVHQGGPINLPWLAVDGSVVIAAHISR